MARGEDWMSNVSLSTRSVNLSWPFENYFITLGYLRRSNIKISNPQLLLFADYRFVELRRFRILVGISFLSVSVKVTLRLGGDGRTFYAASLAIDNEDAEMGPGMDDVCLGSFTGRCHSVRPSRGLPWIVSHNDGRLRDDTGNRGLVTRTRRRKRSLFLRVHSKPIRSCPDVRLIPRRVLSYSRHGYRKDQLKGPAIPRWDSRYQREHILQKAR